MICTFKIMLFREQLEEEYDNTCLDSIEELGVFNHTFLTAPVSSWDDNKDYQTLSVLVRGTSVVNDCAERV